MSYVLKSSDTEITINRSIIPETNDTVDIGSAERKIRDMYISNNSLWLGDDHKLAITSDGTMKFRKRDKTVLPKVLRDASGTEAAAINHVNQKYGTSFTNVSEFKLKHVLSYARTINSTYKTSDIYSDNTEDYEKETAADAWQVNSSKIFLGSDYTNIGIGTNNPNYPLEVKGIIKGDSTLYLGDVNTLSDGYLRIGKNNGTGGVRSFIMHYNDSFDMCISDYGATDTVITTPFRIAYGAPNNTVHIQSTGLTYFANQGISLYQYGRVYSRFTNNALVYTTDNYNIQTQSGIYVRNGRQLLLNSTRKIKKNITDLDDNECLDLCLKLRPKKYQMIDEILNGDGWRYGYISEEVKEDYPEATEIVPLTTPSIYTMADVISEYVIKIDKELILDKKYTCYKDTNGEGNATLELTILEKLENNEYKVDLSLKDLKEVFVYGFEEDTLGLKKDYFHPIHTSSIQQLHRMIVAQQQIIDDLKTRIEALENI